jgi:hypothetical protein
MQHTAAPWRLSNQGFPRRRKSLIPAFLARLLVHQLAEPGEHVDRHHDHEQDGTEAEQANVGRQQ